MDTNKMELDHSDKYCVFQCGEHYYGVPAASVRNVTTRPQMTGIPVSSDCLTGLAYVHREFLPVFSGSATLHDQNDLAAEQHMLVIANQPSQPWGLLVDRVDTLTSLEVSLTGGEQAGTSSAFCGSASYGDQFVTVIDPDHLHNLLTQKINSNWQDLQRNVTHYRESMLQASGN